MARRERKCIVCHPAAIVHKKCLVMRHILHDYVIQVKIDASKIPNQQHSKGIREVNNWIDAFAVRCCAEKVF